ncbi:MAG: hypothetical protein LE180_00035 [Endomicrobium sp.]|uniref:hypothetical protein n=1 Tax=Candidatus Endomicrobiellum pyrsonymphae TaxID=1408203 RepID=UPI003575EF44|nr:hypothetical protein [Endomicrobium sp.]
MRKGDTVVVLDGDVLVHDMWKSRFSEHSSEVSVRYFTQGLDVVDFITSLNKGKE